MSFTRSLLLAAAIGAAAVGCRNSDRDRTVVTPTPTTTDTMGAQGRPSGTMTRGPRTPMGTDTYNSGGAYGTGGATNTGTPGTMRGDAGVGSAYPPSPDGTGTGSGTGSGSATGTSTNPNTGTGTPGMPGTSGTDTRLPPGGMR